MRSISPRSLASRTSDAPSAPSISFPSTVAAIDIISREATASSARSAWSAWMRIASRVVSALTFGLPSRSPPIHVPQRSAGSGRGARRPDGAVAFSRRPSASSRLRSSRGTSRKIVPSKCTSAERTSSRAVTRRVRMPPMRQRLVISSRRRRSTSAAKVPPSARRSSSVRMRLSAAISVRRRASVG